MCVCSPTPYFLPSFPSPESRFPVTEGAKRGVRIGFAKRFSLYFSKKRFVYSTSAASSIKSSIAGVIHLFL